MSDQMSIQPISSLEAFSAFPNAMGQLAYAHALEVANATFHVALGSLLIAQLGNKRLAWDDKFNAWVRA